MMTKPEVVQDTRVQLRISTTLLAEIDEARGDVPLSVWIRRALQERLEREKGK